MNRDIAKGLNYKSNYKICLFLITFLAGFSSVDLMLTYFSGGITLKRLIFTFVVFLIFWPTYYQYFKDLLYSFWGLSLFPFFYFLLNLISVLKFNDYYFHALALLSLLLIHLLLLYLASSPLYYPKVSWWEFDYRYRNDLPAQIVIEEKPYNIRITDMRRKVGSFASFAELQLGQVFCLKFQIKDKEYDFEIVIGSKAQKIIGRPFSYGFKFLLNSKESKKQYRALSLYWLTRERIRIDRKFKGENA